jgi:putative PIN family toxin of toxin-antitoxin system
MSRESNRFVLDTNTLISALLFEHSVPGQAFRKALQDGVILESPESIQELENVLSRKKFLRYVTSEERNRFLQAFLEQVEWVEPMENISICRDPKDNKFLELAVSGSASILITGDRDLLVLKPFRNLEILTPAEFIAKTF